MLITKTYVVLQSAFGLTAYDAVTHLVSQKSLVVTELNLALIVVSPIQVDEMPNAAVNAPKAMVLSVIIGTVSSFIFLIIVSEPIRLSAISERTSCMPICSSSSA